MQEKCGDGKEVSSQAGEREACQNCCGGFIQGSRGRTGTLCHHGPGHEALQCSHLLQLCQHIWTQAQAQGAGSVWRWIHPCTGSALPVLPQIHGEQQGSHVLAAKGGSVRQQNCSLPLVTAPRGWKLNQKGLESLAGTHDVTFSCPQCTQLHLSHLPPHFLYQMQ